MSKYTQQLLDEVNAVGSEYEGYISSVAKLTGDDEPNADQWQDVKASIEAANSDLPADLTLELCEYANSKWDIRLRRVYDSEGNVIENN